MTAFTPDIIMPCGVATNRVALPVGDESKQMWLSHVTGLYISIIAPVSLPPYSVYTPETQLTCL